MDSQLCHEVLSHISDGVYCVDLNGCITYWNGSATAITGYQTEEVLSLSCSDNLLMHTSTEGKQLCHNGMCPLRSTMSDGCIRKASVYLHHKDGHRVPVAICTLPIRDCNGTITGCVQIFQDESLKYTMMRQIRQLENLSLFDALTGLGNRRYAEMDLHDKIANKKICPDFSLGILFIDADKFKAVNDVYGHNTGDKVLKMIATTLKNALRDRGVMYRWGGEEFIAVVVPATTNSLFSVANELRLLVEQSSLTDNENIIRVTVSIGAALALPGDTIEALVKKADDMLYRSKQTGRNKVCI